MILPETDEKSAQKVAERCRSLISEAGIPHEQSEISTLLTMSLGVGTIIPASGDEPKTFIEAVDRLLYKAKQNGRDRIESRVLR
jgi:diguanylate cyclase (GGDEF)-like protein